jgi:hypothetical protein
MQSKLPIFEIGEIIRSRFDNPVVVFKKRNNTGGVLCYDCFRLEELDLRINGDKASYNSHSLNGFYVIGHIPAVKILYS